MAKLVLFLQDRTTLDIPLGKERTTIGRRADNDVCLPYPAVSGEHAAVVTILADSFLEDLGSTNGTLVNGKGVSKHFLRDRDEIDIGRQKLVYVVDNDVRLDGLAGLAPAHIRGLTARVTPARAAARPVEPPSVEAPHRPPGRPALDPAATTRLPSADEVSPAFVVDTEARLMPDEPATVEASPPAVTPLLAKYQVRVLTGASAGRSLPLIKAEIVTGRVGVQVAAIRHDGDICRLVPVEGERPKVNGAAVGAEGVELAAGDVIEIAGTTLELARTE